MNKTPYPKAVTIGTTLKCNIRCIHCGTYLKRKDNLYDMPDEILEKCWGVMEQAEFVSLDNEGEFLCNKDYLAIFRRVRDMGKKTTITTNGMLVDDFVIENVVFDGLDCLNFSVDAVDAETYENFRRGADFDKLMSTIRKVLRLRAERKSPAPYISLSFVARLTTIKDLPAMVDLCHELGVDQLYVYHLTALYDEIKNECLFLHQKLSDKYFKIAMKRNEGHSMAMIIPPLFADETRNSGGDQARMRECRSPWDEVFISANGDIMPCCDWRLVMGNLHEQTFDEIWNGEKYNELRATVNDRTANPHCAYLCPHQYLRSMVNPRAFFPFDETMW